MHIFCFTWNRLTLHINYKVACDVNWTYVVIVCSCVVGGKIKVGSFFAQFPAKQGVHRTVLRFIESLVEDLETKKGICRTYQFKIKFLIQNIFLLIYVLLLSSTNVILWDNRTPANKITYKTKMLGSHARVGFE